MNFIIFLVWYMVVVLPMFVFQDANQKLVKFMQKRGIYWDSFYTLIVFLVILLIVFIFAGYW